MSRTTVLLIGAAGETGGSIAAGLLEHPTFVGHHRSLCYCCEARKKKSSVSDFHRHPGNPRPYSTPLCSETSGSRPAGQGSTHP